MNQFNVLYRLMNKLFAKDIERNYYGEVKKNKVVYFEVRQVMKLMTLSKLWEM